MEKTLDAREAQLQPWSKLQGKRCKCSKPKMQGQHCGQHFSSSFRPDTHLVAVALLTSSLVHARCRCWQ